MLVLALDICVFFNKSFYLLKINYLVYEIRVLLGLLEEAGN